MNILRMPGKHCVSVSLLLAALLISPLAVADDDPTWTVFSDVCGLVGEASPIIDAFCKISDDLVQLNSSDPVTLDGLALQLESLQVETSNIETALANLTFEERREEALSIARAIDAARAQVLAAANQANGDPDGDAPMGLALSAGITLMSSSFYSFPPKLSGAPDHYDPRLALPSFIMAVDTWIAIRRVAALKWDSTSKQQLSSFAGFIDTTVNKITSSVSCKQVWQTYKRVVSSGGKTGTSGPPHRIDSGGSSTAIPPPTEWACSHRLNCTDLISQTDVAHGEATSGACPVPIPKNSLVSDQVQRELSNYKLADYRATANRWRAIASAP